MSYCRWSTDDFQCDLYVYANVSGKWTIHVAGNRVVLLEELPPPVTLTAENAEEWAARSRLVMDMLDNPERHRREPINLPYAGETFDLNSPGEAATFIITLSGLGYNVPNSVVEELREEQAELEASA